MLQRAIIKMFKTNEKIEKSQQRNQSYIEDLNGHFTPEKYNNQK